MLTPPRFPVRTKQTMGRVAVLPCPLSSFGGSRLSLFHLPPSPSCYCFRFSVSLGLGLSELAFSISQSRSSSPSVRGESLLSLILSLSLSCRSLGFRTELSPKSVGGEGLKASAPRSGLVNSARVFAVISLCLRPRFTPPQMSQRRQQAVAKSHVPTDVAAFHPMPPPPPSRVLQTYESMLRPEICSGSSKPIRLAPCAH